MLETIREFAGEQLANLAEAGEIFERHALWYLALAQAARASLRGADVAEHLKRLDPELENFREAISWAAADDAQAEVELVREIRYFLVTRGHLRESLTYIEHALGTARSASLDEAQLLYGAAHDAHELGDDAAAQRWAEQLLEVARARGDHLHTTNALNVLAWVAIRQGDTERARMLLLEAAEPARMLLMEAAEPAPISGVPLLAVAHGLGIIAFESGDTATARNHFQEELEVARGLPNPRSEGIALVSLGNVALLDGDTGSPGASA